MPPAAAAMMLPEVARVAEEMIEAIRRGVPDDEELARALSAARLGPLQELRTGQRDMLAGTLLSWLQNGGNAKAVARQLHIHPQTARYRLRQLQALFGEALGDPDSRFELEIALRARRLLGGESTAAPGSTGGAIQISLSNGTSAANGSNGSGGVPRTKTTARTARRTT